MDNIKIFTITEVNALIPELTQLLEDLKEQHAQILRKQAQIDAIELVTDSSLDQKFELKGELDQLNTLLVSFQEILTTIQDTGAQLKDVERGVIDFYGVVDGEVVFLCWQLGEPRVLFWHKIDQGFSGRKPLIEAEEEEPWEEI